MQRLLLLVCLVCACEPAGARDAGADDARTPLPPAPTITEPAAPEIPWMADGSPAVASPRLRSDCPPGWELRDVHEGVSVCHPYPAGYRDDCGPTGAHFPGEPACRELDRGETEWPPALPSEGTLYVRPGVSGGDGSRVAPFSTIADALERATDGTTIALSPGTHDLVEVVLDVANVRIIGASVSRTSLRGAWVEEAEPTSVRTMLRARAAGLEVSDLSIDVHRRALIVESGGAVTLRRVATGAGGPAIRVDRGGALSLSEVIVTDPDAPLVQARGDGVVVHADHVAILGEPATSGRGGGVLQVFDDALLVLEDSLVDGGGRLAPVETRAGATAALSRIATMDAQSLRTERGSIDAGWLWVERPRFAAMRCEPGSAALRDVTILDAAAAPSDWSPQGISGCSGRIERLVGVNVELLWAQGDVFVSDLVSRDAPTIAMSVFEGSVEAERLDVRGGRGGVSISLATEVTMSDLTVIDVQSEGLSYGVGVRVDAAQSVIRRLHVARCVAGLTTESGRLVLEDASFRDMPLGHREAPNTALLVLSRGSMEARRVVVESFGGRAVWITSDGDATLEDLVVRGGESSSSIGLDVGPYVTSVVARRVEVGAGLGVGVALQGHATIDGLSIHDLLAGDAAAGGLVLASTVRDVLWAPEIRVSHARIVDLEGIAIRGRVPLGRSPRWGVQVDDLHVARMTRGACETCRAAGVEISGDLDLDVSRFVVRDIAGAAIMSGEGATLAGDEGLVGNATTCGALIEPSPTVVFASCSS